MTIEELAHIVSEMRHAQKEYIRTQSNSALMEWRRLEAKLDRRCAVILSGQRKLFPDDE